MSQQGWAEGKDRLHWPALPDAAQDAISISSVKLISSEEHRFFIGEVYKLQTAIKDLIILKG